MACDVLNDRESRLKPSGEASLSLGIVSDVEDVRSVPAIAQDALGNMPSISSVVGSGWCAMDKAQKDASEHFNSEMKWLDRFSLAAVAAILLSHIFFAQHISNWWWLVIPGVGAIRTVVAIETDFMVLKARTLDTNSRLQWLEQKLDRISNETDKCELHKAIDIVEEKLDAVLENQADMMNNPKQ